MNMMLKKAMTLGIVTLLMCNMLNACSTTKPNSPASSQMAKSHQQDNNEQDKHASKNKEGNVQTTKGQKASHGRLLAAGSYFAGVVAGS